MASDRARRLLIVVVADPGESALRRLLDRIPASIFRDYECAVLVVDDAPEDRTLEIGAAAQAAHPDIPVSVLRNDYHAGYGGSQKIGYAFALKEGFDLVALLHGDGHDAPEELPEMVAPVGDGRCDAVFGSGGTDRSGILTSLQNLLLRRHFRDLHTGYRVYSVAALEKIAFPLDTNAGHFDAELVIQLLNARQRILELPLPTHGGRDLQRAYGPRYALDVLRVTLQSVAHRLGVLHQRRFDPVDDPPCAHYDLKLGYPSSHQLAIDVVPAGARVLDIGGGPGGVALALAKKQCRVAVVDRIAPDAIAGSDVGVFQQDLDEAPAFDVRDHDYLLMLDIIEHLKDPEGFLEGLRRQFEEAPKTLVLTTPNVAFVVQRVMLALGQFNYGKAGILDRTHTRLFTFRSLRRLLVDAGFLIVEVRGVPAPFPKAVGDGVLARAALAVNRALIRVSPTLFSYQIFVVAKSTPHVDFILARAKARTLAVTDPGGSSTRPT